MTAIVVALMALAPGCDDAVRPPATPPIQTAWRPLIDLPTLYNLNAVHATGPGEFVGVGPNGLVARYDGSVWSTVYSETSSDLWALWGPSLDDLVAVGDDGVVIQNFGQGFLLLPKPTDEHLRGVWGTSRDDFFVVGEAGYIFHHDGAGWTKMESNTVHALHSVWGSAGDDVFAAGVDGTVVHYDGVEWTPMDTGIGETLAGVHGVDASAVIAVGNRGTIIRYDGQSWQRHASGTTDVLQAVVMTATDRAFAVGGNGTTLAWNGIDWSPMQNPTHEWLFGITAFGNDDVTAVGSQMVLHYDGNDWAAVFRGAVPTLNAVWSPYPGTAFAVGARGAILLYAGERWRALESPTNRTLNAVWGFSETDVYAVGIAGRVMHLEGSEWSPELTLGSDYYDIGGPAPDDVWIVGQNGTILHKDARLDWRTQPAVTANTLFGLWNEVPGVTIAVGAGGEILEWEGATPRRRPSPTTSLLYDVDGYIDGRFAPTLHAYAVGVGGTIVQRIPETGEWQLMESGVGATLYAVGRGPDDAVYAGGAGGAVVRLEDGVWAPFEYPTSENIRGFSRSPSGELFAVGGSGELSGVAFQLVTK